MATSGRDAASVVAGAGPAAPVDALAAEEPEEMRGEPRWSSIRYAPHPRPAQWSRATDEKLMMLVTQSTASGERFPVGVNWLEVSRVVRRSPVDCVKRYALLYDARECFNAKEATSEAQSDVAEPLLHEEEGVDLDDALLDSEEGVGEDEQSFSGFSTPMTSPRLPSLDTSGGFTPGPGSPGSPPPFAVTSHQFSITGAPSSIARPANGSPFRWESLVNDPKYAAPVLNSPPHHRRQSSVPGGFGSDDEESKGVESLASSPRLSPRLMHGTLEHGAEESAAILTHAFKGLKMGSMPLGSPLVSSPPVGSPRLGRKISNSEYPFLKEEDMSARQSAASSVSSSSTARASEARAPFLNDAYGSRDAAARDLQSQMNAHLLRMSAMSNLSSFHGDNPFSSGSVTQSALEDAFLDMAGSRLDVSSVLLGSRVGSTGPQSRLTLEQIQALERERATGPRDGE